MLIDLLNNTLNHLSNPIIMWSDASSRYRTEIADIFSAENKLQLQMFVEAKLAFVQANLGLISSEEADLIDKARANVKLDRVFEIEKEIHHDLMAMVRSLAEQAGDAGGKVHLGATSNDIQDTVLALQLVKSKEILLDNLDKISDILLHLCSKYSSLSCIGRTHGQFAVPTTVGFKFANHLYELQLAKISLRDTRIDLAKFSGAIGNYASSERQDIEENLLEELDLRRTAISTQVVSRVVHAEFMNAMALNASVLERIAKEIRNLQRSEIGEWYEPFSSKQVGSSAMPHKRNPHKSERVSGLVRIIRNNVTVALENIALEHEREITHSSVERIIIPESANLLLYVTKQMEYILNSLDVNEKNISRNLMKASGLAKSEQILRRLVDSVGRQEGHALLREHVNADDFRSSVLSDEKITNLIPKEVLIELFDTVNTGLAEEKTNQILDIYEKEWKNYRKQD